jgi:hypothetical protein
LRQVSKDEIVSLFSYQNLIQGVAPHRSLNRVLRIGNIHAAAGCLIPINGEVEVGLGDNPEYASIGGVETGGIEYPSE